MKLNKIVVALVALFAFGAIANAQNAEYKKGDIVVNALYSLGSFENGGDGFLQHGFGVTGEYGILDNMIHGKGAIGVGAEIGFGFGKKSYGYADIKGRRFHLATRGTMHYSFIPALDTYAGFRVGIADWTTYKEEVEGFGEIEATKGEFIYSMIAGTRYMLNDRLGLTAETAFWGRYSHLSLGVSFKL